MSVASTSGERFALAAADRERLRSRLSQARRRARRHGECLAAVSVATAHDVDPCAVALASRRDGEPWMCLEQPDRGGAALATLGCAAALEAGGERRFAELAARWRALAAGALADPPAGPSGSGLIAAGGLSFAPDGGGSAGWSGFAPASLLVPEISLARGRDEVTLTVAALVRADDDPELLLERVEQRLAQLREAPLPLLDPHPAGRFHVRSAMAPSHYEEAVARATERIRAGAFEKIVLAREVDVQAPRAYDAAALFGVLRDAFTACFVFAVGRGESVFMGATPELLIRREGLRASTLALAGSARRSADPAVDNHLGERLLRSAKDREEHAIVARTIERTLRPHAVWVARGPEPELARIANIQHLATPVRAQLAAPIGTIELAGILHPTPAVGAEPRTAIAEIPALEGLDRGWYAGPIGWTDTNEDGEFCVALRCALLRGADARLYAGVGVVGASDPAAELTETEVKLGALLPLLSG